MLTVTERLREHGVVGKFVEFYGQGIANLPLADRATIGNMSPEFGSTCAIFPIDAETLRYLEFSGRPPEHVERVEAYAKAQGLWHDEDSEEPTYSETLELDLGEVVPSLAGPKRPQDRVALTEAKPSFRLALEDLLPTSTTRPTRRSEESFPASRPAGHATATRATTTSPSRPARRRPAACRSPTASSRVVELTLADGTETELDHGHVVIAAITSCTNTSNPSVMVAAGLLARNAVERGLTVQAVGQDVARAGLQGRHGVLRRRPGLIEPLEALGFHLVGYGCTTCIGNSGPLPEEISDVVNADDLDVVSVLSGNRNFEGRINPDVKMNYLASPPLVVAYALAGTMDVDLLDEPLGQDQRRQRRLPQRHLAVLGGGRARRRGGRARRTCSRSPTARSSTATPEWNALEVPEGDRFAWDDDSTYVRRPPFFEDVPREPEPRGDIEGARVLALLGDSVTTDHISPAGTIKKGSPAALYLNEHGVEQARLQLLRRAPRQPRGDDARHVREHPPAQPAGGPRRPRRRRSR